MKARITFIHDTTSPSAGRPSSEDWDPTTQLRITPDALELDLANFNAVARELHLTLGVDELPAELWSEGLRHANALHLRWQAPAAGLSSSAQEEPAATFADPYASRVPAGLHVFYSPGGGKAEKGSSKDRSESIDKDGNICPLLQKLFTGITKCDSPARTFNSAPAVLAPRFTSSPSRQYYQLLHSISSLADYVEAEICGKQAAQAASSRRTASARKAIEENCSRFVSAVRSADVLDFDYTALSHTVTLRVIQYSSSTKREKGTERIKALSDVGRVEVGILGVQDDDPAPGSSGGDDEDAAVKLSMGGLLTVVGEDGKASPTLFAFPSRHHTSNTRFAVSFDRPTGLHPTMRISFPNGTPKPPAGTRKAGGEGNADQGSESGGNRRTCALHAHISLPSHTFPDKYQLSAPNFLAVNNLREIRSLTSPPPDLEAPDWAVDSWGSNMLLELSPSSESPHSSSQASSAAASAWDARVPLHLRYLHPAPGGQRTVEIAWPTVFWACTSDDGSKMGVSPFDRTELGYDAAFGPRTVFYHLTPDTAAIPAQANTVGHNETAAGLVTRISVPVLDETGWGFGFLRQGTATVLLLGIVWIAWKLVYVSVGNKEARSLGRLAQRERVDVKGGGSKEKAS